MTNELTGGIRLSLQAETDLEDIWHFGAVEWSPARADQYIDALVAVFDLLRTMPGIARERPEFTPPVRIHPTGPHLVIYRVEDDYLHIVRVLGGRQDWQKLLDAIE
ncbi:type II toxin-antitoxin system RelE/ParE family toxin [Paracoccus benzoatiresistens]|uniref:Toxin n=1 Tax=Paracoccus benzoatiresistens TaxID=2997341 RepID=A0ABT4JB28_9RHOB|nr:type II toxin-antitoxin system RelE/ParE family toxin [Paracoccus sp. EF6]MCZ0964342.1 type II toxin-antitoxin system RelE/ParE family toxin [Paracoccus sp. EF6]